MLAKVAPPTNDFPALARYLAHGKSGAPHDPRRVAWVMAHNLPTDDPELAAKYMAATAQLSARTKKAAYHLMIAWHAAEQPNPDIMQSIALQTLELAGLAEHQALIMGHGDKPHPYLHILLNRVHPDTGRAWKTSQDFARFDTIMKALADTHGFAHVPAHTFNHDLTDERPKQPNSRATYAAKRGAPTSRPQWSKKDARTLGAEISEDLTQASSPDDVLTMLDARGLRIEAKGQGFIVGNDRAYAKLSSLNLTSSARGLDYLTLAAFPKHRGRSVFHVDEVDIARAFHTLGLLTRQDVRDTIHEMTRQRRTAGGGLDLTTALTLAPPSKKRQSRRSRATDPRISPKER